MKNLSWLLCLSAAGICGIAIVGIFLPNGKLVELLLGSQPRSKATTNSITLNAIRELSDLATAEQGISQVVETEKPGSWVRFRAKTKLLYIANVNVIAGVDLSELREEDIQQSEGQTVIKLPPPKVLSAVLDVNSSKVYDYNRGFLGLGPEGIELQSVAQQNAVQQARATACASGLLSKANARAKVVLEQLSKAIAPGTKVVVQPQAVEKCDAAI